jgi:hypothetical protein
VVKRGFCKAGHICEQLGTTLAAEFDCGSRQKNPAGWLPIRARRWTPPPTGRRQAEFAVRES